MKSHRITVPEAVRLTERSRRSLYRDMASGRLAYHAGRDGRRLVDVSELIRVYGALPGMPDDAPQATAVSAEEGTPAALLTQMLEVMREQSATLTAQREEMAALREEVRELRALPAPDAATPPTDPPAPAAVQADSASIPAPGKPNSMADVLARFESRQMRH